MGNAHIEERTRKSLLRFMNNNNPPTESVSRGIEELLNRAKLLEVYERENEWLKRLVVMYDESSKHD